MTESKALKELKKGSEEALGWFIDRYTPYVTTIIYNVIGAYMDTADIEEVASDVFLAFWQNSQKVRPFAAKSYLGSIARNLAKNKLREMGNDLPLEEQILMVDEITPEQNLERRELSKSVRQAVMEMPDPEREIFLRYYYYYQKTDRIADEMNLNPSTVRSKLRRGRESLRSSLLKYIT